MISNLERFGVRSIHNNIDKRAYVGPRSMGVRFIVGPYADVVCSRAHAPSDRVGPTFGRGSQQ